VTDFGREGATRQAAAKGRLGTRDERSSRMCAGAVSGDFRARRFAAKCRLSTVAGNPHPKVPLPRINRLRVNPHPSEANRAVPKASSILRGTEGSNLLPSTKESSANLTSDLPFPGICDADRVAIRHDGEAARHATLLARPNHGRRLPACATPKASSSPTMSPMS
jgi:hypothetical protein